MASAAGAHITRLVGQALLMLNYFVGPITQWYFLKEMNWDWECSSVIEGLLNLCKALGSILSITENKTKKVILKNDSFIHIHL